MSKKIKKISIRHNAVSLYDSISSQVNSKIQDFESCKIEIQRIAEDLHDATEIEGTEEYKEYIKESLENRYREELIKFSNLGNNLTAICHSIEFLN